MIPESLRVEIVEIFNEKYCVAPSELKVECSDVIVRAHTIQRAFELNAISENHHVIGMHGRINSSFKPPRNGSGKFALEKISIKSASTFNGFCDFHDPIIWRDIETDTYQLNKWTSFLHGYRSICREYYLKRQAYKSILAQAAEAKRKKVRKNRLEFLEKFKQGTVASLLAITRLKQIYDKMFQTNDASNYRYFELEFRGIPFFQANGSCNIQFSPNGIITQDDPVYPEWYTFLNISTIYTGDSTVYLFGYLATDEERLKPYFDYLSGVTQEIQVALPIMGVIDNVFMRESWWKSLDELIRIEIEDQINSSDFGHLARGTEKELPLPVYEDADYKIDSSLMKSGFGHEIVIQRNSTTGSIKA